MENTEVVYETTREERVQIAQEVLAELENKTITATQRVYLEWSVPEDRYTYLPGNQRSDYSALNGHECRACACGALAVAAFRKGLVTGKEGILGALEKYFPSEQILDIEGVFMGRYFRNFIAGVERLEGRTDYETFKSWWEAFGVVDAGEVEGPKERETARRTLVAVMENIIRNKGDFVLADVPDVATAPVPARGGTKWFWSLDKEPGDFWNGPHDTRDDAFAAGEIEMAACECNDGVFYVAEARPCTVEDTLGALDDIAHKMEQFLADNGFDSEDVLVTIPDEDGAMDALHAWARKWVKVEPWHRVDVDKAEEVKAREVDNG